MSAADLFGGGSQSGPHRGGGDGGGTFSGYGSPFDTLSARDLPSDRRGVFRVCRELTEWSVTHQAYVRLMSTLPVTDLVFKPTRPTSDALKQKGTAALYGTSTSDAAAVQRFSDLALQHWKLRRTCQEMARSFFTYSNAVATVSYPFSKMLGCVRCGARRAAVQSVWELHSMGRFRWKCPECSRTDFAHVVDHFLPVPEGVKLLVLDMERLEGVKNEYRDEVDLYYEIPDSTISRLKANPLDKEYVCTVPQPVLEAALGKHIHALFSDLRPRVRLLPQQSFLMRAATLPRGDDGFAFPEMAATFQDYWLRKVQQKSQEAIHTEMAVLKRFIFPDNIGQTDSLMNLVNLSRVQDKLRDEYARMRKDPGYVGVMPFKVGQALIGGEAKVSSMAQDIKVQVEMEAAGLGVPIEALFGGLQYSGASVSLKQVESRFEDFRANLLDLVRWFVDQVSASMRLPAAAVELKPFRMGEDLAHVQMMSSLHAQQVLSLRHLHSSLNVDSQTEREQLKVDARFRAEMAKVQGKADAATQEEQIVRGAAAQAAGGVAGMEAELDARAELEVKVRSDPDLYRLVGRDPQLSAQIFGANSPEALSAGASPNMGPSLHPQQVDPAQLQQYMQEYDAPAGMDIEATEQAAVDNSQPAYAPEGA